MAHPHLDARGPRPAGFAEEEPETVQDLHQENQVRSSGVNLKSDLLMRVQGALARIFFKRQSEEADGP